MHSGRSATTGEESMGIVTSSPVVAVARVLNRAGLRGVNRLARNAARRLSRDVVRVKADGLVVQGPVDSWRVLTQIASGTFEPFEVDLFKQAVKEGMTVLDIGANIGFYSLLAARLVGPRGKVYAFEPDPRTTASLRENLRANGLPNVTVIQKAASDQSGLREFKLSRTASHSGLYSSMSPESVLGTIRVETVAVDEVLLRESVDVIKLDAEGEEAAVLKGLRRTLERSPRAQLFVEFNPVSLGAAGVAPDAFLDDLRSLFGNVCLIDQKRHRLTAFKPRMTDEHVNLYCYRSKADVTKEPG